MPRATIGSIERYALHDGPGIRTTVFFKGCPLKCPWCHNPELRSFAPEMAFHQDRCIGCGECLEACPEGALNLASKDRIDRSRCTGCGECARACPGLALERIGGSHDVPGLMERLLLDRTFYETSGGGVTLSGGEPACQFPFVMELLRALEAEHIPTAIETSGFTPRRHFEEILPLLDLVLFDLKAAEPATHLALTGVSNEGILANLAHLAAARPEDVIVRVPLIPGYTATRSNVSAIADLLRSLGIRRYALLPYHPYGLSKAESIGARTSPTLWQRSMTSDEVRPWHSFFSRAERVDF